MTIYDGIQNHTLADKDAKTILGLEFVGNGYGKEDSIDKGLPSWNEKYINNFLSLFRKFSNYYTSVEIDDLLSSISVPVLSSPIPVSFVSASDASGLNTHIADLRFVSGNHLGAVYDFTFDVEFDCVSPSYNCILGFDSFFPLPVVENIVVPSQVPLFLKRDSFPVVLSYTFSYSSGYVPYTFELNISMPNISGHYRICGSVPLYFLKVI